MRVNGGLPECEKTVSGHCIGRSYFSFSSDPSLEPFPSHKGASPGVLGVDWGRRSSDPSVFIKVLSVIFVLESLGCRDPPEITSPEKNSWFLLGR